MFVPGNTLTGRAQGKAGKRKLLLVEEWDYVHTDAGLERKREAIFDQGNALNLRGIPWVRLVTYLPTLMSENVDKHRSTLTSPARTNPRLP